MPLVKYRIYELSARAVISYGRQQEGTYAFHLSAAETERFRIVRCPLGHPMRFVSAVCIVSSLVRSVVRIHLIGPIVSVSLICLVIGIMQICPVIQLCFGMCFS